MATPTRTTSRSVAAVEKLRHNAQRISVDYFCDRTTLDLPTSPGDPTRNTVIPAWNTTASGMVHLLRRNLVYIGEPGEGKTTLASLVASAMTGIAPNVYRIAMLKGHPDQTEEKMIGRLDFGAMHAGTEKVIWQSQVYLPVLLLDEFPRLPEGKQAEFLEALEEGRFTYFGGAIDTGRRTFFATANHPDNGSGALLPPIRDRFLISLEQTPVDPVYRRVLGEYKTNQTCLNDPEFAKEFLAITTNKTTTSDEKFAAIQALTNKNRAAFEKKSGFQVVTPEDLSELETALQEVTMTEDAKILLECLEAELTMSPTYGFKRSCDPADPSHRAARLAGSMVRNGLSTRVSVPLEELARLTVLYLKEDKIYPYHIEALAPYVLAHRMLWTEDAKAQHTNDLRSGTWEFNLAQHAIKMVRQNLDGFTPDSGAQPAVHIPGILNDIRICLQVASGCGQMRAKRQVERPVSRENYEHLMGQVDALDRGGIDHPYLATVVRGLKRDYNTELQSYRPRD